MTQLSFATLEHRNKKKQTKRERFLSEMDAVVPWAVNAHLGSNSTVCRMKHSTGWPPEADGVDRPGGPDHARSGNVRFWDKATIEQRSARAPAISVAASCLRRGPGAGRRPDLM